jgi:hypothetical protein
MELPMVFGNMPTEDDEECVQDLQYCTCKPVYAA